MTLDNRGVLTRCGSCGATNRLRYTHLDRATRCGKCQTPLAQPASPVDVSGADIFSAAIAHSSIPVVVDFWAPWCGPCKMMAPEVQKLSHRVAGRALVLKVDTDANPELGERFRIRSIPTIAIFRAGAEVTRVAGAHPAARIEELLAKVA